MLHRSLVSVIRCSSPKRLIALLHHRLPPAVKYLQSLELGLHNGALRKSTIGKSAKSRCSASSEPMDEEEKGKKGGGGGGGGETTTSETAERRRKTGDATKEEEDEEAARAEEEYEERKRLMKGSAPETASGGPQTVRPKSGSPTGTVAPTTPGNQEPRLPTSTSSTTSTTSSMARRSFRLDYRHEEEVTRSQRDASGRFVNPWPTWRFPSYVTILRLFITEKNHSNVPSSKEVLDKELPIMEPFFVRSPAPQVSLPPGQLRATWLGHATVLVEMDGLTILTDPMFSQRASPLPLVGPKRYRDAPCSVEQLPHVDAVLISHNHYDHLDWASVVALERRFGPELRWLVPLGLLDWMHGCGCQNVIQLDWWEQNCVPGHDEVTFVCTPAQHWCKRTPLDDNRALWGSWTVLGPSCRFFFAGDTGYCSSFAEIGRRYGPFDLAAIPIGAYLPRSIMRSQHVDPEEAVKIHIDVQAKHSLAIHWGTFALAYEYYLDPPVKLREAMEQQGRDPQEFFTLHHGESRTLTAHAHTQDVFE